jgi:hypothetical protein
VPSPTPPDTSRRWRRAIVALAVAKSVLLVFFIPPFQTPDEYGHYDYVLYLSHIRWSDFLLGRVAAVEALSFSAVSTEELKYLVEVTGTTRQGAGEASHRVRASVGALVAAAGGYRDLDDPSRLAQERISNTLRNYPPLYYFGIAAVHRAARALGANPVVRYYLARLCSVVLFGFTLVAAAALFAEVGLSPLAQRAALGLLAFHPQLALVTMAVQPDNLALLLATAGCLWLVRWLRGFQDGEMRRLGAALGALALVKPHVGVPLAVVAGVGTGRCAWRSPERRATVVRASVRGMVLAGVIAGGWYLRAWWLYRNPIGGIRRQGAPSEADFVSNLRQFFHDVPTLTFPSYWGIWGWLEIPLPSWLLPWLVALSVTPLLVYACWLRRERLSAPWGPGPWLALLLAVLAAEMAVIAGTLGAVANQGRHWLAYAAVQMMYLAGALDLFGSRRGTPGSSRTYGRAVLAAGLLAAGTTAVALAARYPSARLELSMRTDTDSTAEIFVDSGSGYLAHERVSWDVRRMAAVETRSVPLRARSIHRVRLDPLQHAGSVTIVSLRIVDRTGAVTTLRPSALRARQEIASAVDRGPGIEVTTTTAARDPILEVVFEPPLEVAHGPLGSVLAAGREVAARVRRHATARRVIDGFPLWVAAWMGLVWCGAVGAPIGSRRREHWRAAAAALLVGLVVVLQAWLAWAAYRFYYLFPSA